MKKIIYEKDDVQIIVNSESEAKIWLYTTLIRNLLIKNKDIENDKDN